VSFPPSALAADPARLRAASQLLAEAVQSLRAAPPALGSAWSGAAGALVRQRTGEALESCQVTTLAALRACGEVLEGYARALGGAAAVYRDADLDAVPAGSAPDVSH